MQTRTWLRTRRLLAFVLAPQIVVPLCTLLTVLMVQNNTASLQAAALASQRESTERMASRQAAIQKELAKKQLQTQQLALVSQIIGAFANGSNPQKDLNVRMASVVLNRTDGDMRKDLLEVVRAAEDIQLRETATELLSVFAVDHIGLCAVEGRKAVVAIRHPAGDQTGAAIEMLLARQRNVLHIDPDLSETSDLGAYDAVANYDGGDACKEAAKEIARYIGDQEIGGRRLVTEVRRGAAEGRPQVTVLIHLRGQRKTSAKPRR